MLWCAHGDVVTLLSLDTGTYSTLDNEAAAIWMALCSGLSLTEIVERIVPAAGNLAAYSTARADTQEFLIELESRGLIVAGSLSDRDAVAQHLGPDIAPDCSPAAVGEMPRLPSVASCLIRLALVRVGLRYLGLRASVRRVGRGREQCAHRLSSEWVNELAERVSQAILLCPFNAACLEESLTILWFIFRAGDQAELRIGVEPFPFVAHAWVVHRGAALGQPAESLGRYREFPPLQPWAL